ncbi:MAG TPA: hypothetical protein VF170_11875 [Planctomycetaceae bacterium]
MLRHKLEKPSRLLQLTEARTIRASAPNRERLSAAEKERRVCEYLAGQSHRAGEVTLAEVCAATGIRHASQVSGTDAWQRFQEDRQEKRPAVAAKPIPLTDGIAGNLSDDSGDRELAELVAEAPNNKGLRRELEKLLRGERRAKLLRAIEEYRREHPDGRLMGLIGEIDPELLAGPGEAASFMPIS